MAVSITVVRGPDTGAKHESSSSRIVIGRKKGDVLVRDRETSGLHASIEYLPDGRFLLKDLGSTNGTWLDGRRVTVAELQPGQHVKIGANHLLFTVVDAMAEPTRSHAVEASAAAPQLPDPQWSQPAAPAWPAAPPSLATMSAPQPFAPAPPLEPFAPAPPLEPFAPLAPEAVPFPEPPLPAAPPQAAPPLPVDPPLAAPAPSVREVAGLPPLPPWNEPAPAVPPQPPPAAKPPGASLPPWPAAVPQGEMPALPPLPGAAKAAPPPAPPPPPQPAVPSPPGASADGHPPLPPLPPWPGAPPPAHPPPERSTAISPARPLPREMPLGVPGEARGLPEGVERSVYGLYLLVERGRDRGRVFPINRQVTVLGRSGTDVLINDPDISRRHAALDVQGEGKYILRDLNSTNGTLLNGVPVTAEGVSPNDKIRLGATTIKLIMGDERLAAEHARLHAEPGTHS